MEPVEEIDTVELLETVDADENDVEVKSVKEEN